MSTSPACRCATSTRTPRSPRCSRIRTPPPRSAKPPDRASATNTWPPATWIATSGYYSTSCPRRLDFERPPAPVRRGIGPPSAGGTLVLARWRRLSWQVRLTIKKEQGGAGTAGRRACPTPGRRRAHRPATAPQADADGHRRRVHRHRPGAAGARALGVGGRDPVVRGGRGRPRRPGWPELLHLQRLVAGVHQLLYRLHGDELDRVGHDRHLGEALRLHRCARAGERPG